MSNFHLFIFLHLSLFRKAKIRTRKKMELRSREFHTLLIPRLGSEDHKFVLTSRAVFSFLEKKYLVTFMVLFSLNCNGKWLLLLPGWYLLVWWLFVLRIFLGKTYFRRKITVYEIKYEWFERSRNNDLIR